MDSRSGQEHASAPRGDNIAYFTTKEFDKSLKAAFMGGGQRQKKALKAKAILGSLGDNDPFATYQSRTMAKAAFGTASNMIWATAGA